MRHRLQKGYAAVAIVAVALAFLAVSMVSPVVSTTEDFSIFNSGWNGASGLAVLTYHSGKFSPSFQVESNGADITVAQLGLEDLGLDPLSTALVVIGPTTSFTAREGQIAGDFVRGGGRLLLADDFGTGNGLLEGMGATSRFTGDLVMDLAFEKQPEFSVCFDIRDDQATTNVTTLLLNYPSALMINPATTAAIAYTSLASWRDVNENSLQDPGEPRGPFPVLARESMGSGEILLLSDPSLLINGMGKHMDNQQLATNLIDEVSSERAEVFFDESHREFFDPVSVTIEITGDMPAHAKVALIVLAFAATLWISTDMVDKAVSWAVRMLRRQAGRFLALLPGAFWKRKPTPTPEPMTDEQLATKLLEKHPDWRPGMVRYTIRERKRHSESLRPKTSR